MRAHKKTEKVCGMEEGALKHDDLPPPDMQVDSPPSLWCSRWVAPLLIAALSLSLNLAGNSATGLWDRDEPRFAVAVREMRARGDWLIPTFNGEPRYHKPILIYWLMGLGTKLAGDSPFGVRLVSGLAGMGTCVLVWALGRRMLGSRGGFLAGMILAVTPIMFGESKLATTDATLTFWLVGCFTCLWELARKPSRAVAAIFWLLLSLACLTKGPIGPVFLAASVALAWWWGWPAPLAWKRLYPRWGLMGFAVLTAPWFLAIAVVSHGQFVRFAVGQQILQRVTSGMEAHGAFPGYYLAFSVLAFYPWSALLPAALLAAWMGKRNNADFGFLLGWVIGPLILLECLQTKLIHYYLPAYPASALLVAWFVESVALQEVTLRRWPLGRLGLGVLGGIGIAGSVGLLAAALSAPGQLRLPLGVLALILGAGTLLGMLWFHQGATRRAAVGLVVTWGLFLWVVGGWMVPATEPYRTSRRVGERISAHVNRTGIEPVLLNYQEPGVIYTMGGPVATVRDPEGFFALLEQKQALLSVVTPLEAEDYRDRFGLNVTVVENIEGYSLTKGLNHKLQVAIIQSDRSNPRRRESTARAGQIEQSLVK
jgi:4-amino-4-deoxy-L-arabinose transferase-like glycosyltransferase